MSKIYFVSYDGEPLQPLDEIKHVDLECEGTEPVNLSSESIEFTADAVDTDKLMRAILGQGFYNAMVFKRDGYLSPQNGWIE